MTDRITRWLGESLRLADQATEGPWTWSAAAHGDPTGGPTHHAIRARDGVVAETDYDIHGALDAEFIAETRTRFPQAVAALRAVMELHKRRDDLQHRNGGPICDGCGDPDGWASAWPCPTVQAIADALGGDDDDMG